MTAPAPGYPSPYPPQPLPPQPSPRPPRPRKWVAGLLAAFFLLVAAGATAWGSLEKLQRYRHEFPDPAGGGNRAFYTYTLTWWKVDQSGIGVDPAQAAWYPPFGVVLAVAGGLLVIGAVLVLSAAFGGRQAGVVTAARVAASLGVGVLSGAVAIRLLDALQGLDQANSQEIGQGELTSFDVGLGIWLPGGAVAVGLLGMILALTRPPAARVEPDTPRMGVPMPYGYGQYPPPQPGPQSGPLPAYQSPPSGPLPVYQSPPSGPLPVYQSPPSGPLPVQQPQQPHQPQPEPPQSPPEPPAGTPPQG